MQKKRPPMRVCSVKILTRQMTTMKQIEQRTGASMSAQIRAGIDLWIATQGGTK